jgi:hypothetical protein
MCGEYFWGRVPKSLIIFGAILWCVDNVSLLTPYFQSFQWRLSSCYRLAPRTTLRSFNSTQKIHFRISCFSLSLSLSLSISISSRRVVSGRSSPYGSAVCCATLPGSCKQSDEVRRFCDAEDIPSSCAQFESPPSLVNEAGRRFAIRVRGRRVGAHGGPHCRLFSW